MRTDPQPRPPWVEYPGFPPGDPFWRQAGEPWLAYVWDPFWQALPEADRAAYLAAWPPPADWQAFYLDPVYRAWDESLDD